ncbi:MAG: hypothetical protein LIP08_11430 [Bacteroides sp.]|nr:hypothetical protein [Bacteroides sp.]
MNRVIYLVLFIIGFSCRVVAQSATVDARIDSLQILIGEQAHIELEVSVDAHQRVVFPFYPDTLVRGVEVLEVSEPDTQFLNNRERLLIKQEYTITSFDSALYYLPPMIVQVDEEEYRSRPLALKVYSFPLDTIIPGPAFGLKDPMKPDFVWSDWYGLMAASFLAIPLLLLLFYLILRLRDNKPIIRRIKVEPKIPPHQLAMQEIERVKSERVWQKGRPKEYYTELTDILRTYIRDRFGFNALEMTSAEIIERLTEVGSKQEMEELNNLFSTADLVKFAKHIPDMTENDMNLINAVDFIHETKIPEEEEQKPQPTEITIVEKRSLRAKIILIAGIVLLSIACISIVVYLVAQIYELLT